MTVLEWKKPDISLSVPLDAIGLQKSFSVGFTDSGRGLEQVSAAIWQDNRRYPLFSYGFAGRQVAQQTIRSEISPGALKLHDGAAMIELSATDNSWLHNKRTVWVKTTIDQIPPQISLMSMAHNINPGGSCLAVYSLSKIVASTGVQVDNDSFRAYPSTIAGKPCFIAYFAIPIDVSTATRISVVAEDRGGNKSSTAVPFYIRNVKAFRTDSVNLPDSFLANKVPEFQQQIPSLRGKTPIDTFIAVNERLREENFRTIQDICRKTSPQPLWEGTFLRMKNAAPMAQFGDKRTYVYQGKAIGNSTHMGVDLASTQNAAIEAANNGIVVFTGYMGIYGYTVIVDHGVGIFSHYSHMNAISVKVGQKVAKGEVLGKSGMSGLAGGDHLHYGMVVDHKFVNPVEWWDPHWIKDNVEKKIAGDFTSSSPAASGPEEKSAPAKAHKKGGKKKGHR